MNIRNRVGLVLVSLVILAGAAVGSVNAGVIIPNAKIASGSVTGTMYLINSPHVTELPLSTAGAQGPNWTDNSADGWRQLSTGTVDSGSTQGNSPWEPDGTVFPQGQLRFFNSGTSNGQTYTFNLTDAGLNLPDGAIINAIYATWTTRNTSGGIYSYTEGASNSATFGHNVAPTANLGINWTNSVAGVQLANFQRIFNTPITVGGGDGFVLNVRRSGNTHQTDAVLLDVTAPEIAVSGNSVDITNGDATPSLLDFTDFGSTFVGTPITRTFRVSNSGISTLTTSGLTLPAGYSISEGLSASIGVGLFDDFTVQLDAVSAGIYSGNISFTNNDSNESPFSFSITGEVLVIPEPTSFAMLAFGMISLWLFRKPR